MAINHQEFFENAGEVRSAYGDEFKGNSHNFMGSVRPLNPVTPFTGSCSQAGILRADAGVGHLWRTDGPWTTGSHHRPDIPHGTSSELLGLSKPQFSHL